jgi:hypothetical protein
LRKGEWEAEHHGNAGIPRRKSKVFCCVLLYLKYWITESKRIVIEVRNAEKKDRIANETVTKRIVQSDQFIIIGVPSKQSRIQPIDHDEGTMVRNAISWSFDGADHIIDLFEMVVQIGLNVF